MPAAWAGGNIDAMNGQAFAVPAALIVALLCGCAHEPTRQSYGMTSHELYRMDDDPNDLVIVLKCADLEGVKAFGESDDLKAAMERAGVIGTPTLLYLEDVEAVRYKPSARPKPEARPPS